MRAVVTGANGHLGSTLCAALLEKGADVVACVRKPHSDARMGHLDTNRLSVADFRLGDVQGLASLFAGSDVIFHTAAPTALWAKNPSDISEPIYDGTLNVIRAAADAGVKKIVYTSTCAAVGFHAPKGSKLDESHYNKRTTHPQFAAKLRAERDGADLAKLVGVEFIRVCPPSLLGPGFASATPSTESYVLLAKGELHVIPDLNYSILDVRDFAESQILLATHDAAYDRYLVGGTFVTTVELLSTLAKLAPEAKLPRLILPAWWLPYGATIDAAIYFLSLRKTQRKLTMALARECMSANQDISDLRFRSEFPQWSARPLDTTLSDTLRWIKDSHVQ